ncbi:MAG: TetR/AcrR family transcriptional regulator [Bacteroidetes bacterium]|nr:TetR/AcrR family transcriptional regulator [Bacteroidota bacterium]MBS1539848.1 TetR/AcrR family transcriptional regulator [Bacteroidota bacterium]
MFKKVKRLFSFARSSVMTKGKILSAAQELFEEKGLDGASVRDIAHKANVNVALINYHFGSKDALIASLVEEMANASYIKLADIYKSNENPLQKLFLAIDMMMDKIIDNKKYYQMLHHELSTLSRPGLREQMIKNIKRNRTELKNIIEEGQEKKIFRTDIDIELTVSILFGMLQQVTSKAHLFKDTDHKLKTRLRHHLQDLMSRFLSKK